MATPIQITASEGKTFASVNDPTKPIGTMLTLAKTLTASDFIEIDKPVAENDEADT